MALIANQGPVINRYFDRRKHHGDPHQRSDGADQQFGNGQRANQKLVRIQQRKTHEHYVQQPGSRFPLARFLVTLEKLGGVPSHVVLQEICQVKLREQLNDCFLAGRFIGEAFEAFLPNFLHRAFRAQSGHELIGRRTQPEKLIAKRILEGDPTLAAEILAAHFYSRPEINPLVGNSVPRLTKCCEGFSHGNRNQPCCRSS